MWIPGVTKGARVSTRVGLVDVAPTLLEAANLKPLDAATGVSLLAAAGGGPAPERSFWSELATFRPAGQFEVALTRGSHRFIVSNPDGGVAERFELYDLSKDPGEYVNLASANEALVDSLSKEVDDYVIAGKSLHAKLVPEEARSSLTAEQRAKWVALGYLNPGGSADDNKP